MNPTLVDLGRRPSIPARRTGTYSDRRHPDLPRDIRRAVEGQRGGWQRLRRFQQMMAYPSMNTAADALGLHTQNLNLQLQRLEADIGAQLLHRARHRHEPMTLTRRGNASSKTSSGRRSWNCLTTTPAPTGLTHKPANDNQSHAA